jgi:hypothetical protein
MGRPAVIFLALTFLLSCTPPPPIDEDTLKDYGTVTQIRSEQFRSAAYLIELRVNDDGQKYSVNTELYFSGDSVGFYGRGYLGKGAYRGQIIDDRVIIYFNNQDEYFQGPLADIGTGAECASPGEVLLVALSLLSRREEPVDPDEFVYPSSKEIRYHFGRFERTVTLNKKGFPKSEKLIDPVCTDSIFIKYHSTSRKFPFYKIQYLVFYNEGYNFRAKGFVREQKYNIDLKPKKFTVNIPPSAVRLESL